MNTLAFRTEQLGKVPKNFGEYYCFFTAVRLHLLGQLC